MVEDHELTTPGVEHLGSAVRGQHMDWLHLPIPDVSVPDARFEAAWATVGPALRDRLTLGFDVLVHCKGGLGRAALVACRLLVESGWTPDRALAAVRKVRPGAVETPAQARYVQALGPMAPAQPPRTDTAIRNRSLGALLGLAVGDALGTTLEFSRRDSLPPLSDIVGGGPFALKPAEWTDDTAMALALADSLAAEPDLDETDLMRRFVSWHARGSYSCTGRCFDIGVTTRTVLGRFERTGEANAGSTDPMSAGNGSLMRLAPVAIRHWHDPHASLTLPPARAGPRTPRRKRSMRVLPLPISSRAPSRANRSALFSAAPPEAPSPASPPSLQAAGVASAVRT